MINSLYIRKASIKDIEDIFIIEKSIFNDNPWTKKMIKSELENHNHKKTLLISDNQNIMGYLMIHYQIIFH